jgi:CMP-N-acetylneuraminic acid synthetase
MKYLCLIPARQGSQRIKNKNMKIIGGKPLIFWTIKLALKCKFFTRVAVSTNSKKIKNYLKKFNKIDLIDRPSKLSLNNSTMESVIRHAIDYYKNNSIIFDAIVLLQPTSPLRTLKTINSACKKFNKNLYETLVSIKNVDHKSTPDKLFRLKSINDNIENFSYPKKKINNYYKLDGGVIFIKKLNKFKKNLLSGNTCFAKVMYPESIDIDNFDDFLQAKNFF